MTSTVPQFISLVRRHGSNFTFHREDGGDDCPCLTPTKDRDPKWHRDHPSAPVCNENGKINYTVIDFNAKGFVQPIQSRGMRLAAEDVAAMFGEVQSDDHLGMLPISWDGHYLNFRDMKQTGTDFVSYHGQRFFVVNTNLIPDPSDGNPEHHWEVALRLVSNERPV